MKRKLQKLMAFALIASTMLAFHITPVNANPQTPERVIGKTGFFGGITEGRRLPRTTDTLFQNARATTSIVENFSYTEVVFINGTPTVIEGVKRITTRGGITNADFGTYRITHRVDPVPGNGNGDRITRNLDMDVHWRRDGNQIVRNFTVRTWQEVIRVNGQTYTLRPTQSSFYVSSLEDVRPGATYFRGTVSSQAVFGNNSSGNITVVSEGQLYGFNTAWSNAESNIMTTSVFREDWQLQAEVRSSVSVNKTLQFTPTQPTYISFAGNYVEIMQNRSFITYDLIVVPQHLEHLETRGSAYIRSFNNHEHLTSHDTSIWRGHFAEADINQLFAMNILQGEPRFFVPGDAVTRSEFVQMLVRSIKLPLAPAPTQTGTARNPVQINLVFPDVGHTRPDFPYIMAAYNVRLALGRGSGHFEPDSRITREEVITLLVRALGLTNLGQNTPITQFTDNDAISSWAVESIEAAVRLGLIYPDDNGNIHPRQIVTKAEAAAWIVRFIDYMRHDLQTDYTEHLLFF